MIRKHNFIVIAIALLVSTGIWIGSWNKAAITKKKYTTKIFQGIHGWGYDILVNDTLFIHQETIPAKQGKNGFLVKKQAEQAARLIINKMERGELPTVTTFEMEQIMPLK
jgi:hypothetical protein